MSNTTILIDKDHLRSSIDILRAITHPLRLKIIKFIDKNEMAHVNKIYSSLKLEQSITSQHLKILREAGVVVAERHGKFMYYKVNYNNVAHILERVKKLTANN